MKLNMMLSKENLCIVKQKQPVYGKYLYIYKINCLCRHYHPTVKKYANDLLKGNNFSYSGNPLLDF